MKAIDYDSAGQWPRTLRDAALGRASLAAASICSMLVIAGAGVTGHYLKVSPTVVMLVALAALVGSSALLLLGLCRDSREQRALVVRAWTLCLPLCASPCLLVVATFAPIVQTLAAFGWSKGGLLLLVALAFAACLISAAGPLLAWLILHKCLSQQLEISNASARHTRSAVIAGTTMLLTSLVLATYQLAVMLRAPPSAPL